MLLKRENFQGAMDVSPDLFAHFIYHLKGLAGGKILLCLEDGYNERNVALCVERCLRILLGEAPNPLPKLPSPKRSTVVSCLNVISMLLPHWQQCFGFHAVDGTQHARWEIHHPKIVFCAPRQRKRVIADRIDQSTLPRVSRETTSEEIGDVTALAYDPRVELHREEIDMGHIERPDRTSSIAKRLRDRGFLRRCAILQPREATHDELRLVHQISYIKRLESITEVDESERRLEEDRWNSMYFCKDSFRASIAAVGSILECVDAVLDKERKERARNAFALIRPPGHHATSSQAAGFCIFNNVAIAAKYAIEKYGLERILVVDWDVHHGNGIQEIFYSDPHVLYISLHRHDDGLFYPANEPKDVEDDGEGAGLGYSINIPFSHGRMSDNDYRMAFTKVVMPIAYEYSPQLVIVSSGFDAAYGDILGGYELSAQCYAQLTYQLGALAKGRIIIALEGGYSLTVLQDCAEAVVRTLLDRCLPLVSPVPLSCTKTSRSVVRRSAWETIRRVCLHQSHYWACLKGLQVKLVKGAVGLSEVNAEPEELLSKTKLRDETEPDESTTADEFLQPSTEKMAKHYECNQL
uniref:histone deacetylase n=1 Tax=Parascaris univalens TaxID=6257 RepID=A0A915BAW3_PARUN